MQLQRPRDGVLHLDAGDRRREVQQPGFAKIIRAAVPWQEIILRRRHDGIPAFAFRKDLTGVFRGFLAQVKRIGKIRSMAEP